MKYFILIILLIGYNLCILAQNNKVHTNTQLELEHDSLEQLISGGDIHYLQEIRFAQQIISKSRLIKNKEIECMTLFTIATIYLEEFRSIDSAAYYIEKGNNILAHTQSTRLQLKYHHLVAMYNIKLRNFNTTKTHLFNAIDLALDLEDNKRDLQLLYNLLSIVYYNTDKTDSSLFFLEKALEFARSCKDDHLTSAALSNMAILYFEIEHDSIGMKYNREAISLALKGNDYRLQANIYSNLALFYTRRNELELALKNLDLAEEMAKIDNCNNIINNNRKIRSTIYQKDNNYKKALEFYELYVNYKDSISNELMNYNLNNLHAYYKSSLNEQEIKVKTHLLTIANQRKKAREHINYTLITLIILVIVLGYFLISRYRKNKEINAVKLQLAENALDNKNRDLTAFALDVSRRNEFANNIYNHISAALLINNSDEIVKEFNEIKKETKKQLDINKSLRDLQLNSEKINSAFFEKLENDYPNLTKGEKQLCGFIKINLSTKDILFILNISPETIKNKRYRLKKKLELDEKENLDTFVKGI